MNCKLQKTTSLVKIFKKNFLSLPSRNKNGGKDITISNESNPCCPKAWPYTLCCFWLSITSFQVNYKSEASRRVTRSFTYYSTIIKRTAITISIWIISKNSFNHISNSIYMKERTYKWIHRVHSITIWIKFTIIISCKNKILWLCFNISNTISIIQTLWFLTSYLK